MAGSGAPPDLPENAAVLAYLTSEKLESWSEVDSPWIVEGYVLEAHPDLVARLGEIGAAAGTATALRYLYGKAALLFGRGVIGAFAAGTHVLCMRVPRDACDPELVFDPERYRRPANREPLLLAKQRELDRLVDGDWTRVDPWPHGLQRYEGTRRLAALLDRAVARVNAE